MDAPPPLTVGPAGPLAGAGGGTHRLPGARSPVWAVALGWLVPGAGQVVAGRVGAGLVLLLTIGGLFAGGLALTDFTCVNPRTYPLEFVAQALIGGPTAAALHATAGVGLERLPPWIEVGRLFVVVAGFLNLVALCDALGDCLRRNAHREALAQRLRVRAEEGAALDLAAPALARADEPLPAPPAAAREDGL